MGDFSRARIRTALAMLLEVLDVSQGCSVTHSGSLAEAFVCANKKGWGRGKGQAQGKELLFHGVMESQNDLGGKGP